MAAAALAGGGEGGRETVLSWGRRSGSWGAGGVAAADREFNRILKSGVDVFKHSCKWCVSCLASRMLAFKL